MWIFRMLVITNLKSLSLISDEWNVRRATYVLRNCAWEELVLWPKIRNIEVRSCRDWTHFCVRFVSSPLNLIIIIFMSNLLYSSWLTFPGYFENDLSRPLLTLEVHNCYLVRVLWSPYSQEVRKIWKERGWKRQRKDTRTADRIRELVLFWFRKRGWR